MAQVNGTSPSSPSSAFLSHLTSYPLISDSISTLQSNPYSSKPISLTSSSYKKLSSSLSPYLATPYHYISPYISKADSIGDSTLSSFDSKFPVVRKPTKELYADGKSVVFFPLKKGGEGKDYVFDVYGKQVKEVQGQGVVGYGKAIVATGLVVSSDALSWLGGFLGQKKKEVKDVVGEKTG
ncbi:hypothetical protein B7494_g5367 [Chlorociboria aeruginascens]|nr:hypothetical protein B7494_g5367 [Chlorociboria aeruginascens]